MRIYHCGRYLTMFVACLPTRDTNYRLQTWNRACISDNWRCYLHYWRRRRRPMTSCVAAGVRSWTTASFIAGLRTLVRTGRMLMLLRRKQHTRCMIVKSGRLWYRLLLTDEEMFQSHLRIQENSAKLTNQRVSCPFTSSPFSFHVRHILPTSKFQNSYSCVLLIFLQTSVNNK